MVCIKKFFKYRFTLCFFLVSGVSSLNTSLGATSSGSVQVSATVASSCSVTATTLAFGNYTLAQLDAISTITATCTNGTTYTVGLNDGTFAGATTTTRRMSIFHVVSILHISKDQKISMIDESYYRLDTELDND
jgi:spore coat protein U-like protein